MSTSVNLLKRLQEREMEEGIVGEGTSVSAGVGQGIKDAFINAINDLTAHQKTNLILLIVSSFLAYFQADLVNALYFEKLIADKQAFNTSLESQISQKKNEAKGLTEFKNQIEDFNNQLSKLRSKIREIESIRKSKRDFSIRLTEYVVTEMPDGVWLREISVDSKTARKVSLTGKSLDFTLIGKYIQQLEKGAFFPKWNLVSTGSERMPEGDKEIRLFNIDANIVEEAL